MAEHYGDRAGLKVLSYNALITWIVTNRSYGKGWAFKKRAFKRGLKKNRCTLWLRLFEKEMKKCADTFIDKPDLLKYMGAQLYNKEKNTGNIKREGYSFYCRKSPKHPWQRFLIIDMLPHAPALRDADLPNIDTIVLDEFSQTPEQMKRFRGNAPKLLLDIAFSMKREHKIRIICLGNKEQRANPFFAYFGIEPPKADFEGIRRYRNGTHVLQQINNIPPDDEYNNQWRDAISGTSYGNFVYKSDYKTGSAFKIRRTPDSASLWVQVATNSGVIKISSLNGSFYINRKVETSKPVYYLGEPQKKYRHEYRLVNKQKKYFDPLVNAFSFNEVFYDSHMTGEITADLKKWLAIQ